MPQFSSQKVCSGSEDGAMSSSWYHSAHHRKRECQYQLSYDKKIGLIMHLSGVICSLVDNAPIPKKYNYKNIISTHKKTYEYLYDLVEMIEEPFHIQFSDSDIASLITIIKEI